MTAEGDCCDVVAVRLWEVLRRREGEGGLRGLLLFGRDGWWGGGGWGRWDEERVEMRRERTR